MKKISLFLFVLAISIQIGFCQQKHNLDSLDSFIEKVMTDWKVPGLAIAIVKDGEVIFENSYGYKNLETKQKVNTNTLFSIASSSKAFTATLAAILNDEKKISWETPLINYFPDFKAYNSYLTEELTIKDLLTHRSGIPRQKFFSLNTPSERIKVREAFQYFEPNKKFRTHFQYCNETYSIVGDMLGEIEDISWEQLLKKRLLSPLEMNQTIFSIADLDDKKDHAFPYIIWEEEPELMDLHNADILGAAGCIISNVKDLAKWLIFNLNNGRIRDLQIISQRNLNYIQSPHIVVPSRLRHKEFSHVSYGIGWFIDHYRGQLHVHHGGVLYGFSSQVSTLPQEKLGVVVLANLNGTKATYIIERYVYDLLTGKEPTNWNKRYKQEKEEMIKRYEQFMEKNKEETEEPVLSLPLKNLCGNFISDGYGSMKIWLKNDTLRTKLLDYECPLLVQGENNLGIYHPVEHRVWPMHFEFPKNTTIDTLKVNISPGVKAIDFIRIEEE